MSGDGLFVFNGINGATGAYLLPPQSAESIAAMAFGERKDSRLADELAAKSARAPETTFEAVSWIDVTDLSQAGWGVIFPRDTDPAIREALKELLDLRREQAGRTNAERYREFSGQNGYIPGESHREFLARRGVSASQPADPDRGVPYYLLIVGDPESIPFSFQYQLDVQYAVGRIWFDTTAEYAQYARGVVAAERREIRLPRKACFFGPQNPDDGATRLSSTAMLDPLVQGLPGRLAAGGEPTWTVEGCIGAGSTKDRLSRLLGGEETPALLYTASHGMGFPTRDPRQAAHQGALLCQDWPGPLAWRGPIPERFYFAADDLSDDANVQGLVAFHFACYGAGTPRLDDFSHQRFANPIELAPRAFLSKLPRRLLAHPRGGALAVIGHVERAWGWSFFEQGIGAQMQTFESTLYDLMRGMPVGVATDYFNLRYAALATELSLAIEDIEKRGVRRNDRYLAGTWTSHNDARSYVVLGDPAVRLPLAEAGETEARPVAERIQAPTKKDPVVEDAAPPADQGDAASAANSSPALAFQIQVDRTIERFERDSTAETTFGAPASASPIRRSNDPRRLRWRLERLGIGSAAIEELATEGMSFRAIESSLSEALGDLDDADLRLERILGRNDLVDAPRFMERGVRAARPVARLRIRSSTGALRGWGTGSLIGPRMLLTNNHVFSTSSLAANALAEFQVQDGIDGVSQAPVVFRLRPDLFFVTDAELDYSLVAVEERSKEGLPLSEFGWNSPTQGDDPILVNETVNIVQHPGGRSKQAALRDNVVTAVLDDFLHYRTDTEPGSSGSPVFNDQWDLVGLHHSGVPRRDERGNYLLRDGSIWRSGIPENQIDWIANEGVRLSRILDAVRSLSLTSAEAIRLRGGLFDSIAAGSEAARPSGPRERIDAEATRGRTPQRAGVSSAPNAVGMGASGTVVDSSIIVPPTGSVSFTLPLTITVSLGAAGTDRQIAVVPSSATPNAVDSAQPVGAEAISIDPDYENREGFDPEFLGSGALRTPLPKLTGAQRDEAARLIDPLAGEDPYELRYHHFSVVMNATRRIAFYTAVNIDGQRAREIVREDDAWFFDPRIDRSLQIGNELYSSNPFDRGHLVRRLDPAWGRSVGIAKVANDDTFHWTNCSPQHSTFNQRAHLWQGIENFLLSRATKSRQKLTVFTGPVLRDDDPEYRGVQVPREYWKVAALVGENDELTSLGFMVTQADLIEPMMQEAAIDTARTYHTPVAEIEALTGLDFGQLRDYDVERVEDFAVGATGLRRRSLGSLEEIALSLGQTSGSLEGFGAEATFGFEDAQLTEVPALHSVSGTDLRYWLLAYDAEGAERTPDARRSVLREISDEPVTDVFLFSHGWRSDIPYAHEQYRGWLKAMADCEADRRRVREARRGFRPLLVGLHWPSEPWGEESLTTSPAFEVDATIPVDSVDSIVADYAPRLGDSPQVRDALRRVAEGARDQRSSQELSNELREAYRELDEAVGLGKEGPGAAPGADWEGLDALEISRQARLEEEAIAGVSFGFSARDWLLAPLRSLSFWKMKDRARLFGETGAHSLLVEMLRAADGRDVRFHLAGHSFGCIVASAAIAGPPGSPTLPRPVDSLVLLQGAFSLWSYCRSIPDTPATRGYFRRIVDERLVRGPIVTTQSRFDRAVGVWYPRAAGIAGQVAFALNSLPQYGAVGSFGIQGPGVQITAASMLSPDAPYRFRPGRIYNVDADAFINEGGGWSGAHSDIRKPAVAHLVWSAVAAAVGAV